MSQPDLPCFCINLDEREDKWANTIVAFEKTGIRPKRFSAIRHSEGWRGCGASHIAIAREAMRQGLPWVLIVEDDCLPTPEFSKQWPTVKEALWKERDAWDIFLGGPTYVEGPVKVHKYPLFEIGQGFALHFYVLHATAYEKALAWNPDRHGPIDVYYSNIYRIVTTYPFLATQQPSLSDIKKEQTNYTDIFHDADISFQKLIYSHRTRDTSIVLVCLSLIALAAFWKKR